MFQVAAVIKVEDFPQGGLSYFTLEKIAADEYELIRGEKRYTDEWDFLREVSGKIAGRTFYGVISYISDDSALSLSFRGTSEVAHFEFKDNSWKLYDYEDFNTREESLAMRRFKISGSWEELKKALA